jgi:hypothetical protein
MGSEEAKIRPVLCCKALYFTALLHIVIFFSGGTHPVTFSVHPRNKKSVRGEIVGRAVIVKAHAPGTRTKITWQ